MRLACVGDVGIDAYAGTGERPGGIALNVAVSALAGGLDVSLVSAIGDDPAGDRLFETITPLGLDITHLRRLPGATPCQKIEVGGGGERRFTGYIPGVLADWELDERDLAFLAGHDAIFAPLADGLEDVFESVTRITGPVKAADFSIDSDLADGSALEESLARYVPALDIVFIGARKEHIALAGELGQSHPGRVIVLTLGARGAVAFHHGARYHQPAITVARVVDTTGGGDAFQGAFIASFLQGGSVADALRAGAERAALAISHFGSTMLTLPAPG